MPTYRTERQCRFLIHPSNAPRCCSSHSDLIGLVMIANFVLQVFRLFTMLIYNLIKMQISSFVQRWFKWRTSLKSFENLTNGYLGDFISTCDTRPTPSKKASSSSAGWCWESDWLDLLARPRLMTSRISAYCPSTHILMYKGWPIMDA